MMVPFNHVLLLSGLLFLMGMFCTLTRRNLIMILLGVEIMLNAASLAFVGSALRWQQMEGHAVVIFIMAVAATEVSVGLALIISIYRRTESMDPDVQVLSAQDEGGKKDERRTSNAQRRTSNVNA